MGFFDKLFGNSNDKVELNHEELVEAGACPNCWGQQEYAGAYREFNEDPTKSNINRDKQHQKAFVAQFVETHVTGIKLKKNEGKLECPTCTKNFI